MQASRPNPYNTRSRHKQTRQFGSDLTNFHLLGQFTKQHQLSTASNQPSPDRRALSQNRPRDHFRGMGMAYDPLDDHIADIMQYTVDRAIVSYIEEDYLVWHAEINQNTRDILINWMVKINTMFRFGNDTLCLAVYLVDKYCYMQTITRDRYHLLGLTSLFMAAKYQQLTTPRLRELVEQTGSRYERREIVEMEGEVLGSVGFGINSIVLLREVLLGRVEEIARDGLVGVAGMEVENESSPPQHRSLIRRCQYMLAMVLLEYRLNLLQPHYLSSVLLYICCKMEKIEKVNSRLIMEKYSLSESIFKDYFQQVLQMLKRKNEPKFQDLKQRFELGSCQF